MTDAKKTTKKTTKKTAKGRTPMMTDDKAIETAARIWRKGHDGASEKDALAFLTACGARRYLALQRYAEE